MKVLFQFLLLPALLAPALVGAQTITTVQSRWSDSFVEWEIYAVWPLDSVENSAPENPGEKTNPNLETEEAEAPEEELFGNVKLRWLNLKDDFSEWDYTLGEDEKGTIRQKWKDDPTQWELRTYDGSVITMRAAWANDFSEWRVTDNDISLTFRSRWTSQYDEWLVKDSNYGKLHLYTLRSRDPRDWAVEDGLDAEVSSPMKMAMIFLAVFHASPRQ